MDISKRRKHDQATPLFKNTSVYLLISEEAGGRYGWQTEDCEAGNSMLCYLSHVDAMIDGIRHAKRDGKTYRVVPGTDLCAEAMLGERSKEGFAALFHMGWAARDRRIILHTGCHNGAYRRYASSAFVSASDPALPEVSPEILSSYECLRERAGLFAWRETDSQLESWGAARLSRIVERAIESADLTEGDPSQARQLALFDPEGLQWHFVPISA